MKTVINKINKNNLLAKLQNITMQQFKYFIKKVLLKVPFVNFIFIYLELQNI
jgi:hypothetical protein